MRLPHSSVRFAALVMFLLAAARAAAAQGVDVIRGQVTGPDNAPNESANVTATSVSGGVNRTARTDRAGRFTITFPGGEGDYFMSFTSIGFVPKRFEIKRTADEEILVADARLTRAAAMLDTIKVTASVRNRADRDAKAADIGGNEQSASSAAVAASQAGDLNAMAGTIPGVTPVAGADGDPSGFSVLGLSSDQNSTTLNGSPFNGSNIPRDANVTSSVITTPYDVSRGGFSGAQFNINSGRGSNFIRRTNSLNFDAPPLQWTDASARALGQRYTNVSLGGAMSGPIQFDKAYYNVSYQLGQRSNDINSLFTLSPLALQSIGIAPDSVTRLVGLLARAGVPTVVNGRIPQSRVSDNGSVFGSVDYTPPNSATGQTFGITFPSFWNRQTPASNLQTEFPAHSGDRTNLNANVQGSNTAYVKGKVLSESGIGVNLGRNYGTPYAAIPDASALVNSTFADGTSGVRPISFGGNGFLGTSNTTLSFAASNQLSWFSRSNKHRIELTSELRRDAYEQDQTTQALGSFYFNSLADLEANRPASHSRALQPRTASGSEIAGALSLGDSYKRSKDFQIQYGLRLDGNRYALSPSNNPDVDRLFGERNDVTPSRLYLSPRVGFSWT